MSHTAEPGDGEGDRERRDQGRDHWRTVGAVADAIMGGTGWGQKVDNYLSGIASDVFGGGSNGGGLQVSDGRGGSRSADALDAMNNPDIADALGYGGGGGGSSGGMTGAMGGYGNADGSPSNNSPGIW